MLLDVNCSAGAFGYSWLVRLTPAEAAAHRAQGRDFLDRLAGEIQDGAPILEASVSAFKGRDLGATLGPRVAEAIARWRAEGHA